MNSSKNVLAIQRLTALWALVESGLGGLLHALQTPFLGLIMASIAVIIISLICSLAEKKWETMMSSLLIVLIIKAAVSPHSGITAYMAVSFQAILGAFLFKTIKSIPVAAILLAVIGVLESALQKLLVLTLLFGNSLWESLNTFGEWVSDKVGFILPTSSTSIIITTYLTIYLIGGLIAGYVSYRIINSVKRRWEDPDFKIRIDQSNFQASNNTKRKRSKVNVFILSTLVLMSLLIILSYFQNGPSKGMYILIRTVLILGIWYVLLGPILLKWVHAFLRKKETKVSKEIQATFDLLPYMKYIINKSWSESKKIKGIIRWKTFLLNTLLYSLHFQIQEP